MREIVFDTETTGLDPNRGDRVVEIGCVELENFIPSGQTFHVYINPERDMPAEAERIHGLSSKFLSDKPVFASIVDDFLAFIGDDSRLVAHNATFDFNFINAELKKVGRPPLVQERIVDTLALARRRNPGGRNSLDDLCSRYGIDNSKRTKHGALLDSEILAEVYAELMGGRQASLGLSDDLAMAAFRSGERKPAKQRPEPLAPRVTENDIAAHAAFVATLGGEIIWREYQEG